jgi:hypothetical protein
MDNGKVDGPDKIPIEVWTSLGDRALGDSHSFLTGL